MPRTSRGRRAARWLAFLPLGLAVLLAACGGGDSGEPATASETAAASTEQATAAEQTTAQAEEQATTAEQTTAASGAVTTLTAAGGAVVRIVAQGSFQDPDVGQLTNVAGSGSGFIIDPSGLAVTNNHVVTGAALLQVFVEGDSRARNARILAVSECSDLAVIDLEGDGYPYLRWFEGEIQAGLAIFAAGFPLGDPEFTLTGGIISKADADGESQWASVDHVVEHDALLIGGNSGGPLLTVDGRVVGVNYASNDLGQAFAISRDEVKAVLDRLIAGVNVDSLGINGQAIVLFDVSGIWVASVDSGSAADLAGIQPGDIVTRLEGLLLATDGTMADYCDILRTRGSDSPLAVEVLRQSTGQILEGRLNSGTQLEESFSFAAELETEFAGSTTADAAGYSAFTSVQDDTATLVMEVPQAWGDVDGSAWVLEGTVVGPAITAAASIDAFFGSWTEPGVFFGASETLAQIFTEEELLDLVRAQFNFDACTYVGRFSYEDPAYTGVFDRFEDCAGEGGAYISLVATPPDGSILISVQVQVVTEADAEALDRILNSFFVIGDF